MRSQDPYIFFGNGQTSQLARSIDWSKHPLGKAEAWDQSLKTTIGLAMGSKFPMFVAWGEEKYFFYNDSYAQILGSKHPVAFGKPFQMVWSEIWDDLIPLIRSVENDEAVYLEDLKLLVTRNGYEEETYFTFSYSPVRTSSSKIEGLFCAVVETTSRVLAEKEIKNRETEVVNVLEGMSDGFFTLDSNWIIKRINLQFERIIGMKRTEVIGKSLLEVFFYTPEQLESLYVKTYQKAMTERTPSSFVDYYEPLNIWTSVSVFPTDDGGIAVFFKEISDERRAAKELEDAIKSRDEFISIASHELKTPLTSLKLQAQLHEKFGASYSREKLNQNNKKLVKLTNRLDRLVEDMLDISRLRTGELTMQKQETDVFQLCKEVIDEMQATYIAATGGSIIFNGTQKTYAVVDKVRLEQVLTNLLQNALKYGKGNPVTVTLTDGSDHFLLSVNDKGMGIATENLEKVFERFERAISANEISGLGLGLFICKQIITAHQGKIWVESKINVGSTFNILIPR
jgi:PAS domain S-box-containing protein